MHRLAAAAVVAVLACAHACAQPFTLIDFDDQAAMEAREGIRVTREPAQYQFIEDGASGTAVEVSLPGQVMVLADAALLDDSAPRDVCNGVAFMLRGDGSDNWGCVTFAGFGSDMRYAYSLYVPLADTSWHEVRAHFAELVAEPPIYPIGEPGMLPPGGVGSLILGTRWTIWWNNAPMPEHSYAIDEVRLIADAPEPEPAPSPRPLSEVLQRLRDREPVTIQCMGDSVTAGTGLRDRDNERYATLLQTILRERLGYDGITCYSRAVGGAKLNDARFWWRRDFAGVQPDLVTLAYGYNDKSNTISAEYYRYALDDYIDRIARATGGGAAICPVSTLPGASHRFVMLDDFAQQVRELCAQRGDVTCIDLAAQIKPMGREAWGELLGDLAHPNAEGHEWIANAIADWLMERVEGME